MPSTKEIRKMAKRKKIPAKKLSKMIYGNLRKTKWKKEHEERMKIWKQKYEKKYGKYTIEKARKLGLLPPKSSKKWTPPKHGERSEYFHVRLKSPTMFKPDSFRTVTLGKVKQVFARNKKTNLFEAQNILIPKKYAKIKGDKLIVDPSLKRFLEKYGIKEIRKMKSGGDADFKAVKCPGGKIRSRGRGRGLGIGKGKGPIGRHREKNP